MQVSIMILKVFKIIERYKVKVVIKEMCLVQKVKLDKKEPK